MNDLISWWAKITGRENMKIYSIHGWCSSHPGPMLCQFHYLIGYMLVLYILMIYVVPGNVVCHVWVECGGPRGLSSSIIGSKMYSFYSWMRRYSAAPQTYHILPKIKPVTLWHSPLRRMSVQRYNCHTRKAAGIVAGTHTQGFLLSHCNPWCWSSDQQCWIEWPLWSATQLLLLCRTSTQHH